MITKKFFIVSLAVSLLFGLFGTAFAGEADYKTIVGTDQFVFNAPQTMADLAASHYVYDQQKLALVGTEKGSDQFNFDAPVSKEDLAARSYNYDPNQLAAVGTEKGSCQFKFETMGI
jgi:hypothetical protein